MSVADSLGDVPHVTHYEVGHEIELDEAEAARLNENRTPENYRVVRVGGELETGAFKATQPPRSAEVQVSTPGVPGVDELRGAGLHVDCDPAMGCGVLANAPGGLAIDNVNPGAADDEAAPDWSTYLAAVSAAEAAKTIRDLESAEDVEAAIEAEEAKGGLKRPLVIRAGKAAIRRLHRV